MAMSRKHYVEVASMINSYARIVEQTEGDYRKGVDDTVRNMAQSMAIMFAADNSNFDRARFIDACFKGV